MWHRILTGATLVFSALVLALCLAGIVGTWVGKDDATDLAVELLAGGDQLAQTGRNGLIRVESGLDRVRQPLKLIQTVATTIGQQVADRTLIASLLPDQTEQRLETAARNVAETFAATRESVASLRAIYRGVNALPFVDLPQPEETRLSALGARVDVVTSELAELSAEVRRLREGVAGVGTAIAARADRIDNRLGELAADLEQLDARLAVTQARLSFYEQLAPFVLTLGAVALTLLLAWVAYTQWVVLRLAWASLRGRRTQSTDQAIPIPAGATPPPTAAQEPAQPPTAAQEPAQPPATGSS